MKCNECGHKVRLRDTLYITSDCSVRFPTHYECFLKKRDAGKYRTLEEDIIYIWEKHSMKVIKETVKGNCWIIKAERIDFGDEKKVAI